LKWTLGRNLWSFVIEEKKSTPSGREKTLAKEELQNKTPPTGKIRAKER